MAKIHDDPKALVTGFRISHQMLIDTISQIQLSLRSYHQLKPKLRELYGNLHNHFSRQDPKFYEQLLAHYATDRTAVKMLEFLTHDLKDIKVKYLIFSDQHTGEMGGG